MTVLADVNYVEPWWMQILKSLVIFLVVFNFVPVVLMADRKLLGRFQQPLRPQPRRARSARCSRSPTS